MQARLALILTWGGSLAIAWAAFARMFVEHATIPWWDLDVTRAATDELMVLAEAPPIETSITWAWSLGIDALVWLAAACVVLGAHLAGRAIGWRSLTLVLTGTLGVLAHGFWLTPWLAVGGAETVRGSLPDLVRGSVWAAAMVGGWAMALACRDAGVRRVVVSLLLGAGLLLAAQGAWQFFVEHPARIEAFGRDAAGSLARFGEQAGTPGALVLERRMNHADATGWFALSNVFGSVMAGLLAAWLVVGMRALRTSHIDRLAGTALIAAGAVGLFVAQSKGAVGALALTMVGLTLGWTIARQRVQWVPMALPLVVLAGVAMRGSIGERIGELSILFRWHYLVGAARIASESPIVGVGPSSFQPAYALHKLPISPEDVSSPHSVFFDWWATLGLFGLAWVALWVVWLASAGRRLAWASGRRGRTAPSAPERGDRDRHERLGVFAIVVLTVAWMLWRGSGALTLDAIVVRLVGAVLWGAVSIWLLGALRRWGGGRVMALPLVAMATILAAHAQIELTAVIPGAALVVSLALVLSGGPSRPPRARWAAPAGCLALLAVGGILVMAGLRAGAWEARLSDAAAAGWRASVFERIAVQLNGVDERESDEALHPLAQIVGHRIEPARAESIARQHQQESTRLAAHHLMDAWRSEPAEPTPALRAIALLLRDDPTLAADAARELNGVLPRSSRARVAHASAILIALEQAATEPTRIREAIEALEAACATSPHALTPHLLLVEAHVQAGDLGVVPPDQARRAASRWAERVIEIDDSLRLDPLRRLPPSQRQAVERMAAGVDGGGTSPE